MTTYERANYYGYLVVTTTGDDDNGGYWGGQQSGNGVNYSTQDDAQVDIDGTTITAEAVSRDTMEITGGYTVSDDDCGNGLRLYVQSGSKVGYYATGPIESVDTSANSWYVPSLHGPWNGITAGDPVVGRMGGAMATPGEATSRAAGYNAIYCKAGTYTLTSNVVDTSGGVPQVPNHTVMSAFKDTPGDHFANASDRAILLRGTTTDNGAMIQGNNRWECVSGFDVDCDDEWQRGIETGAALNCIVRNAADDGYTSTQTYSCAAYSCAGYGYQYGTSCESYAQDCGNGFYGTIAFRCLAHGCAGYGFYVPNSSSCALCIADDCGTGFYSAGRAMSGAWSMATNCTTGGDSQQMAGLAATYNNTANWASGVDVAGGIATMLQLTQDPYEDRTGSPPDYRINDTAGGGAELDDYAPKWAAGTIASAQENYGAILKSGGGGGSSVAIPATPVQMGM